MPLSRVDFEKHEPSDLGDRQQMRILNRLRLVHQQGMRRMLIAV